MSELGKVGKVYFTSSPLGSALTSKAEKSVWKYALADFALASITGTACVLFVITELMSWTGHTARQIIHNWMSNCKETAGGSDMKITIPVIVDIFTTLTVPVTIFVGFYFLDKYLFTSTYEDSNAEKKIFAFRSCFVAKTMFLILLRYSFWIFPLGIWQECNDSIGQMKIVHLFTTTGLPFIPLVFLMFYVIEMNMFRLFVLASLQKNCEKTLDWLMLRSILSALGILFTILYLSLSESNGFWMKFIFFTQILTFIYKPMVIMQMKDYLEELTSSTAADKIVLV